MLTKDFELAVYNVIIQIESFVNCENLPIPIEIFAKSVYNKCNDTRENRIRVVARIASFVRIVSIALYQEM